MCKFMSSFPKNTDIIGAPKRNTNLELFLQPCKDKNTYYRVRLLAFESKSGERKDPHITRKVHKAWVTDPKTGKKKLERIVCSRGTPWIETEGPKNSSCKICNYAGQQWTIYNESGKTDTLARQNAGKMTASFEAIIPVYVRNDPNYEKNNGKFKVIIMNDEKQYKAFRELIEKKSREVLVFNGGKAVDCLIHVNSEELTSKSGKTYKKVEIDRIVFSTNPTEIPAINSKSIDAFPFDDTYRVSSDDEEVEEFYKKHCAIVNDDIPEDDEVPVFKREVNDLKPSVKVPVNEAVEESVNDIPSDEIDSLISEPSNDLAKDPDEDGLDVPESTVESSNDIDSEAVFKELGI